MSDPGQAPRWLGGIGRHTLVYTGGLLLNRAISLLLLPLYTSYLTPADYGVLTLVGVTMDVWSILAGTRVASGIFYLHHQSPNAQAQRVLLSTALLALAASYAVVTIVAFALSTVIARLVIPAGHEAVLIRIAAAAFLFDGLTVVPLAYLQLRERSVVFVAVTAVKLLVQVVLNVVLLVVFHQGVLGILLSTLTANVLVGTSLGVYLLRDVGVHFAGSAVRRLVRFGLPLVGTQVATFIATYGDRYFLASVSGEAEVGVYSLAYQFGFLLVIVGFMPFNAIWEPRRFAIAQQPERDSLYARGFVICNLILLTVAVGIVLFVSDALVVIAPPAYHRAALLVPLICVAYVLQSWSDFHSLGIMMRERTQLITVANWAGALAALGGYVWLIPSLLGTGAALATVIGFAVRQALIYLFSQRLWPVQFRWAPVLRQVVLATLVCGVSWLAPRGSLGVSLLIRGGLFLAYLGGLWWAGVLSREDRQVIRAALRSPRMVLEALKG